MPLLFDVRFLIALSLLSVCGCGTESSSNARPEPGQITAAANAPSDGSPVIVQPSPPVAPTAEQMAQWKAPDYVPLQLLACNDGFDDPGVQCLAVSPDGKQYVLGGAKLTLWNTSESQPTVDLLAKYKSEEVDRPLRAAAISADGKWLAAGDGKGMVRLWNLDDQKEVVAIEAHQGHITQLAFSPDSRLLATTSYSGDVNLWQLPEGKKLNSLKMDPSEIRDLLFVSKNQLASAGSEVGIWNVETGKKESALTTKRLIGPALGLSSDRRLLAFNDGDAGVRFWDVEHSQPTDLSLRGAGAQLIAFSHDGKRLATQSGNAEIRIWDAASGSVLQVIDVNGGRTSALAWLPQGDALLVASEYGRVRLWGTPEVAKAVGVEPLKLPPVSPVSEPQRALSSAQLKQVIDVRSLERLPGAAPQMSEFSFCSYTAPAQQQEAETFYRYVLGQAGWTESPPSSSSPGLIFQKDGCQLNVTFSPAVADGSGGAAGLQISLQFAGNYDVRRLPKLPATDAKSSFESFSSASYRTKGDLTDVEAALLKQCHAAGWTAYTRLGASSREETDSRTIQMLQGGSELTVSIGHPADSTDELYVQTSVQPSELSLPLPPDSGWIEFDSSTDLQLVANTKMNLQQAVDFFDKQMAAEGWLAREAGRQVKDDGAWLPYLREQQDVYLRLTPLAGGGTRIIVGDAARFSWQLQKPVAEKTEKTVVPGVEAADFALPPGATAVKFDVDAKRIDFELSESTPTKLGELFVKQMDALQWKRDGAGIVGDDYTFITYAKDKAEIQLRARPQGKNATAMISGDGLLWTKPLPTAPVRVSYETWLRRNRRDATLDRLDEFVAEMHKIPAKGAGK